MILSKLEDELIAYLESRYERELSAKEIKDFILDYFYVVFDGDIFTKTTGEIIEQLNFDYLATQVNKRFDDEFDEPKMMEPQITDKERRG